MSKTLKSLENKKAYKFNPLTLSLIDQDLFIINDNLEDLPIGTEVTNGVKSDKILIRHNNSIIYKGRITSINEFISF